MMTSPIRKLALSLALAMPLVACGDDGGTAQPDAMVNPDVDADVGSTVAVSADISADTTWTADKTYVLETHIFVRGATLTIEAGTLVKGDQGSSLVITNDSQIDAVGTAAAPIVFTSNQAAGSRGAGDWGGVVLLGKAGINVSGGSDNIEGFAAGTAGTEFGGTDDAHDCGTLKYARIEFAGFEIATDNELNGLTVGGCGSATELDYIQVHKGADDGVEFFGGTAGISHVIVSQPDDDGLDWDNGWRGNVQFLIVQQSATAGDKGFESDNNGSSMDATPRSAPTIYNATLIGSNAEPGAAFKTQGAMHLREGTAGIMKNFIIAYFADYGPDVDDFPTVALTAGETPALTIESSYFYDNANDSNMGWPAGFDESAGVQNDCDANDMNCFDEAAFFNAGARMNTFANPMLAAPLELTAPSFAPMSDAPVLSGGATPPAGFDTSATFIGAIGATDWTASWTAFPAN
jgi:hypothetical protein